MSPEIVNGLFAVGGAISGAVVGGLITLYGIRKSRDRKEITISTSSPSRLLVVHDRLRDDVQIIVSGEPVENVLLSEIYISNTGNRTVENLDFRATVKETCSIISAEILDQTDDAQRAGALVELKGKNEVQVTVDYINPGEEIALRSVVSGEPPEWDVPIRQSGLAVLRRSSHVGSYSDVVAEAIFEVLRSTPILSAYIRITVPAYKKYLENRSGIKR